VLCIISFQIPEVIVSENMSDMLPHH